MPKVIRQGDFLPFAEVLFDREEQARKAAPILFITYSEGTLNREATSRNLEHQRAFRRVKELIGEKPLVLDREFSYEWLFQAMVEKGVTFVVRLNTGNRPTITDEEGNKLSLSLKPGERVFKRGVFYKGRGERQPGWGMAGGFCGALVGL